MMNLLKNRLFILFVLLAFALMNCGNAHRRRDECMNEFGMGLVADVYRVCLISPPSSDPNCSGSLLRLAYAVHQCQSIKN